MVNEKSIGGEPSKSLISKKQNTNCPKNVNEEFYKRGKKYVRLVTPDLVRDLIIPETDGSSGAGMLSADEYNKLQQLSKEEQLDAQAKLAEAIKKKEQLLKESLLRKEELIAAIDLKEPGPILNKLEDSAAKRAGMVMAKVDEQFQELQDEVKTFNSLILATKCSAIRDAQIQERQLIQKDIDEEDKRLNAMMEQQRLKELLEVKEKNEEIKKKKKEFAQSVIQQIKEIDRARARKVERMFEDAKLIDEASYLIKLEDLRKEKEKAEAKEKSRLELNTTNELIRLQKEREREQARLDDLKMQEYLKQKEEQAAKRKKEELEAQNKRMAELAKVFDKAQEHHAVQETKERIQNQRILDEAERQWRQKEKQAARKRIEAVERLKIERQQQLEQKKIFEAMEIQKERLEEEEQRRLLVAELERSKAIEKSKREAAEKYKVELLQQIHEKELERVKERRSQFEEAYVYKTENAAREESIRNNVKKKIERIKTHNIPEKYIKQIEAKAVTFL